MLGCYKYAARPVLVVMASARNMTHEMKNLQELKEEDWEATPAMMPTKNLFLRHRQRHRERVIHAFAVQLLGENLIYCDGECATHSHSVRSVSSKIYTFFVLCFIFVAVV
jgi:hypothetical protein